jgi:hypothetical protein
MQNVYRSVCTAAISTIYIENATSYSMNNIRTDGRAVKALASGAAVLASHESGVGSIPTLFNIKFLFDPLRHGDVEVSSSSGTFLW